jgi:hypothetical protein
MDRKDVDLFTRRSLIKALSSVARRLDAPSAAETAKDLRARLDRNDADPETQQSMIEALGSVAGRLDAPGAAEAAKDLRARLDGKAVDFATRLSLIDALASIASVSGPHPTSAEIATMRVAMGSIAWPLRDIDESPALARLETISGKKYRNVQRLLFWLRSCCKLAPSAARPPFAD